MRVDIFSLYPDFVRSFAENTFVNRGLKKGLVTVHSGNYRDFGMGVHKQVDDTLYGGGAGMLLRADVVIPAVSSVMRDDTVVFMMSPRGDKLTQSRSREWSQLSHIVVICGHYEGIDERVIEYFKPVLVSVGDYILTNGALAACVMMDAIFRHVPGFLGNTESLQDESFVRENFIESPHYTKPREYKGMSVPDVLLSGHHEEIMKWRAQHSFINSENLPQ